MFDAQVTQLLADLENSMPANSNILRFPGEESQRRKAEILSRGILDLEDPTYAFLCSKSLDGGGPEFLHCPAPGSDTSPETAGLPGVL